MSHANISRQIKLAVTAFDKAAQEVAFVGTYDPEFRDEIEERHVYTRDRLEHLIAAAIAGTKRK